MKRMKKNHMKMKIYSQDLWLMILHISVLGFLLGKYIHSQK